MRTFFTHVYARLVSLYPSAFRKRFEAEMVADFSDALEDAGARHGFFGMLATALRTYWNVGVHVMGESIHGDVSAPEKWRFRFVSGLIAAYLLYVAVAFSIFTGPYLDLPDLVYTIIVFAPHGMAALAVGIHAHHAKQSLLRVIGVILSTGALAWILTMFLISVYSMLSSMLFAENYELYEIFDAFVYPIIQFITPLVLAIFLTRAKKSPWKSRVLLRLSGWNAGIAIVVAAVTAALLLVANTFIPSSPIWYSLEEYWRSVAVYVFALDWWPVFTGTYIIVGAYAAFLALLTLSKFFRSATRSRALATSSLVLLVTILSYVFLPPFFVVTTNTYQVVVYPTGEMESAGGLSYQRLDQPEALQIRESCDVYFYETFPAQLGTETKRLDYNTLTQRGVTKQLCEVRRRGRIEGERFYLGIVTYASDVPRQENGPMYDVYVSTPPFQRIVGYQPQLSFVLALLAVLIIPALVTHLVIRGVNAVHTRRLISPD